MSVGTLYITGALSNINATGNITTDGSAGVLAFTANENEGGNNLTFSGSAITLGSKNFQVTGVNVDSATESLNSKVTLHNSPLTTTGNVMIGRGSLEITGTTSLTIGGQLRGGSGGEADWGTFVMNPGTSVTTTGGVEFLTGVAASNLDFNGGTLTTPSISGSSYFLVGKVRFNGTTVVASTDNADFLKIKVTGTGGVNAAEIKNGGAIFDTNGKNITILPALINAPGNTGTLTKQGSGILTLSGTNTYTGDTTVSAGKLVVNGSISTSVTTVSSSASLGGNGTVGVLTVESGAFVTPGNSTGILAVNGNYTQAGQYTAEIAGITAGAGHDQISVTGSVNITNGSLVTLFSGSGYNPGDLLFILLNDGTGAITGTYAGLAQGATVTTYGGLNWTISYSANGNHVGSPSFTGGNDIALMAIPEPRAALLGSLGMLALLRRRRALLPHSAASLRPPLKVVMPAP